MIRQATLADAPAIYDAHRESVLTMCAGAYSPAQLDLWFRDRTPEIHHPSIQAGEISFAGIDGRVLGFFGATRGEVTLLFVRPEARGTGLADRLLSMAVERAGVGHDDPLLVFATVNSRRFYERHGFVVLEETFFVRGPVETRFEVFRMERAPAPRTGRRSAGMMADDPPARPGEPLT